MTFRLATFGLAVVCAALALSPVAHGQEDLELGKMWTFENVPTEYFRDVHGFELTQEWLDAVRLASLRFGGGCSASFVSPRGLIMTNHHCCRDFIAAAGEAAGGQDWVEDGFVAASMADEVKLEGLAVRQLVSMQDVTARMNEGITASDDESAISARRAANQRAIVAEADAAGDGVHHEVTSLYQGGMFQLYGYKTYTDVRLVVAPHLQTAHFGGDPDNFTYPRYGIDFTFCRAYENDQPVDSSGHHFTWRSEGADEGELVFVTGNPGRTNRLMSLAQMEFTRDVLYPVALARWENQIADMRHRASLSDAADRELKPSILGIENALKAYGGYLAGLQDSALLEQKARAESAFRKRIAADPELAGLYADAWDRLADLSARRRALQPRAMLLDPEAFGPAVHRAFYVLRNQPDRAGAIPREMDEHETAVAVAKLELMREWLGAGDPVVSSFLGGREPQAALAEMARASTLDDEGGLEALLGEGRETAVKSEDRAMAFARLLDGVIVENGRELSDVMRREEVQKTRVGQAMFAIYGTSVSADATGTLRLSDGVVRGFSFNGTIAPPWTSFYGLYGRNVEFGNRYPFDLPQIWLDRRDRIDMSKKVDFVSTNDIIGGNSGSPVIDAERRVVGLVFDGNIEMLPNNFLYRDDVPRSVSVHPESIEESLTKIYDAGWVMDELHGR